MYTVIETKEMAQSLNGALLDYVKEHGYMLCKGMFELEDGQFVQPPLYEDVIQAYEEIRSHLYVTQTDPMGFKIMRDEVSKEDYIQVVNQIKSDWATPTIQEFKKRVEMEPQS